MEFLSAEWLSHLELGNGGSERLDCVVNSVDELMLSSLSEESYSSKEANPSETKRVEEEHLLTTNKGNSLISTENMIIDESFPNSFQVIGQPDQSDSPNITYPQQFKENLNFHEMSRVEDDLSDSSRGCEGTKRAPATIRMGAVQAQNHVMAERMRRERMNQKFISLAVLIPGLRKMDKASILGDAAKYIKQLQECVQTLEAEVKKQNEELNFHSVKRSRPSDDDDVSSSFNRPPLLPEVEAMITNKTVVVRLRSGKRDGFLDKLSSQLETLHLYVVSCNVVPFSDGAADITIVAQMADEFCLTLEELKSAVQSFL